ncbi:MAG: alpha/beta hydrolase [Syntrophomonadaceae bacterium]|jgi:pimeloyl-ACP methyl ester carboxylesterase|nr:alpha/beta hydrolase [Syntrophomonadaceae bacterium]
MFCDKYYITNQEGSRLACLLFLPAGKPRFQLVVAHGFRGAKENSGRIYGFAKKVTALGGSLTAFDFAGSGESEGSFSDMTLSRQVGDLQAVIGHVLDRDKSPLILLGRSFGGSTVLVTAAREPRVTALVLWSAPVFLTETFFKVKPHELFLPGEPLQLADEKGPFTLNPGFAQDLLQHNFTEYLRAIGNKPMLVIHGEKDTDVDPRNARFLGEQALGEVEVHIVPEADHRFTEHHPLRDQITLQWLDNLLMRTARR